MKVKSFIVSVLIFVVLFVRYLELKKGSLTITNQYIRVYNGNENSSGKNLNSESRSFEDKALNSETRSFEDKCLTTFNESESNYKIFENKAQNFEFLKTEEGKKYKKILAYPTSYSKSYDFGFGHEPFEAACCKEKRCFMTNEMNLIPLEDFDAVLIHFKLTSRKKLPKKRRKHQRWIFFEVESPIYSNNPQDYEGIFNWTMTYRNDSDVQQRYGYTYKKTDFSIQDFGSFEDYFPSTLQSAMKTKKKMAAWFVSHCGAKSKREEYAKKLQKFLPVDIYGLCGPLKCDGKLSNECYQKVEREYKFYLSFENSLCKDYVTEKFFNMLRYYVIPVVRGSADYADIAPPHSYINVNDYKSQKDLAEYLKYLDKNDTAYMEYFIWKKDYFIMGSNWLSYASGFCNLCQKLHSDKTEKVYYNLKEWFSISANCNKGI